MRNKGWILLMTVLLVSAVAGIWNSRVEAGVAGGDESAVLSFAQARMDPDSRMTLKWYGSVPEAELRREGIEALGRELTEELGISGEHARVRTEGNHAVYEAAGMQQEGIAAFLFIARGELILKLEASGAQMEELLEHQGRWSRIVAGWDYSGRWIAAASGWVSGMEENGEQLEEELQTAVGQGFDAAPNGYYSDGRSVSITFVSKQLEGKASDTDPTALQLALHRDSNEGRWKLTLGTPMLTGEF